MNMRSLTQTKTESIFTPVQAELLQRKCTSCGQHTIAGGECAECQKKRSTLSRPASLSPLQRRSNDQAESSEVPPVVHEVLNSPGHPLEPETRNFMESRFRHDFSQVRVHTDIKAAQSAQAVNALAYTIQRDIVFGAGQYAPRTVEGTRLLAHELTHVVQQRSSHTYPSEYLSVSPSNSSAEQEAQTNAEHITAKELVPLRYSSSQAYLQRQEAPIDRERRVRLQPRLDLNIIQLTLDVLQGRHQITVEGGLSQPLNLLEITLPGVDPSQLTLSLGYGNRCNETFQRALIQLRQTQEAGGPIIDFGRNPWQVDAGGTFRAGSVQFGFDGTIGFRGSEFDTVLFGLTIATGVSTSIPEQCRARPSTTPSRPEVPSPTTPSRPETPQPSQPQRPTGERQPQPQPRPQRAELPSLTLYFFYNTSILRPESNSSFRQISSLLQNVPQLHVQLTGHASLEGTDAYNLALSRRRAEAIRDALVTEGIAASRIQILALGEFAPAVPEPQGVPYSPFSSLERIRNLNRRVEVVFFDPTGQYGSTMPSMSLRTPGLRLSGTSPVDRPTLGVPRLRLGL